MTAIKKCLVNETTLKFAGGNKAEFEKVLEPKINEDNISRLPWAGFFKFFSLNTISSLDEFNAKDITARKILQPSYMTLCNIRHSWTLICL